LLELTAEGATAIYDQQRIPLPLLNSGREDYLRAVIELDPNNAQMKQRLANMLAPSADEAVETNDQTEAGEAVTEEIILVPGTCQ